MADNSQCSGVTAEFMLFFCQRLVFALESMRFRE